MGDIYTILKDLDIKYTKHTHPAVFTVEESRKYDLKFDCGKTKNLFLTNRKGDTNYLLVVDSETRVDLKKVTQFLHETKLSFTTPEVLFKYLELTPGSVSPFGLINDIGKTVTVLIDKTLMEHEKVGFHPNINTATLVITTADFKKFLDWTGNRVFFVEV